MKYKGGGRPKGVRGGRRAAEKGRRKEGDEAWDG